MISWDERIRAGVQAAEEWRDLPLPLLIDKILKAAGTRDLVVENNREKAERLEADIDYRLLELWTEFPPIEDWDVVVAAAFMRAAYGRGYIDALEEERLGQRGKLCRDNDYRIP